MSELAAGDVETLLRAAEAEAGLDHWGDDDFREPLGVLLGALEGEAGLSEREGDLAAQRLVSLGAHRLRVVEDRRRDPRIADQEIERPLVVVGFPRTGTTLLHSLLGRDPANRLPRFWEVVAPSPPPESPRDPRIEAAGQVLAMVLRDNPMLKVHYPPFATLGPLAPVECGQITEMDFTSYNFWGGYRIPSYTDWLLGADLRSSYAFHRRFLQHLQAGSWSRRWALKAPPHLAGLEELRATYPDACVVWTHRDLGRVLPSLASLLRSSRGARTRWHGLADEADGPAAESDAAGIGAEVLDLWRRMLDRAMEYRARSGDPGILDVSYSELTRDPIAALRRIYRHFDLPYSEDFEAGIRSELAENPQGRQGRNAYSIEEFGYTREQIDRDFADYNQRFAIEPELETL